jgi:hypothetical protein
MVKLSSLKGDATKTQDGVWADYEIGLRFKIARMNNPRYRKHLAALKQSQLREVRRGNPELILELTTQAMAKYLLLDWEGLDEDDGTAIPYSIGKSAEILRESQDIYEFVEETSMDSDLFKAEAREQSVGN